MGLQCNSAICLDWREICNGIFNCENGEDEPEECRLLEINECEENEYRCRFGMCIPKTFLRDFSLDCMDLSDEKPNTFPLEGGYPSCFQSSELVCDFRRCDADEFSCGDGQCLYLTDWNRHRVSFMQITGVCNNGRDLYLRRNLFRSDFPTNGSRTNQISFDCWFLMLCISDKTNVNLFGYNVSTCLCTWDTKGQQKCLKYFEEYCPASFIFQTENNFLYPFGQFLYHNASNASLQWWRPTHLCYNFKHCPDLPFITRPLIDNLSCITIKESKKPMPSPSMLLMTLSACALTRTSMLTSDKRLFYCHKSMKYISKHKIFDGRSDCILSEDEDFTNNSAMIRIANSSDRFKCSTTDQWAPRQLIGNGFCEDKSDTLYIGECKTASDIACQFLRGLYSPPINYMFRENCDGFLKLPFPIENETDETSCEEWPKYRRCDDYWDLSNGEDELNCSNTIVSYITQTVLKCRVEEHYCVYPNGTMGCLGKEYAGDGIIDCLGATDERTTTCTSNNHQLPFKCHQGICLSLGYLCDQESSCSFEDDELICPWSYHVTHNHLYNFVCKNGTALAEARRCDKIIDCQPDAEDEWLCDLKSQKTMSSLDFIEEYPTHLVDSSPLEKDTRFQRSVPLATNDFLSLSDTTDNVWYCNRGIIVTTRSSKIQCFCSPSYYGPRCEYQSERLLITLRIDTPATLSGHRNPQNAIRLVAGLMYDDKLAHYETILHERSMKQMFYLNYPRPPPKQRGSNWSVRLDAFSVSASSVNLVASWLFDVPFSFLPYNRLVLHLLLQEQETCSALRCVHGSCKKYLNSPHGEYCQCERGWSGRYCDISTICACAGGEQCLNQYRTQICVCPLGRMGHDCHMLYNPCKNISCQNGGTCVPLDERLEKKFTCACHNGYYGTRCELTNAYVDIHFSKSLYRHDHLLSIAVVVHFLETQKDLSGILWTQNRVLHRQMRLNTPLRALNNDHEYLPSFIFLQIFFEPGHFGYYIAAILKKQILNLTTTISPVNRCPYVNELLQNGTTRKFPLIKKVKYYHRVCKENSIIQCFHDEAYLCFCDKDRLPHCLFFQREPTECRTDYCQNDGRCVQNNFNGTWDFACVCSGCTYGLLCQLTTSEYALSLDTMLGQDILANVSLADQPLLIKIMLAILILMLVSGSVSNILSFITFKQPKVQEVGCGAYLFCLPIIGQLGLLIFFGRFLYLLGTQLYNVDNHAATLWSCIGLEYFLNVCPMLFDWLTACVAVERSINMVKGVSFKKSESVRWAKRIVLLLSSTVLISAWHELFIHQLVDDPRATTRHTWCVVRFRWSWLKYYRLVINLANLIVPSLINLVTTVFLLHKSTKMKQKFGKKKDERTYFATFKKQLPLYGSPLALVVLSLMRLIFSVTLVCIIHQWQKYFYLMAYFISFAPLMGTFPIFVLPAELYKTEFKNILERIHRKLRIRQT
jgi:hypothetical protein